MKPLALIFFFQALFMTGIAQPSTKGFDIIEQKDKNQISILYNGRLLTAYCYYDSVKKPFLYPINTLEGITVTRGYPLKSIAGESTDHPHHTGLWMNYESVNDLDFWNNSTAIPAEKSHLYGTIRHEKVVQEKAFKDSAVLSATANWLQPDGKVLLHEFTTYVFRVRNHDFIIDRISTLTSADQVVAFKDSKDGFFAIRVAKELEMPSQEGRVFVDNHGNKTEVGKTNSTIATGMYISSEGLKGDSVWSSKGRWVMLNGQKEGTAITIAMMDHPSNVGYPAYWHARGYGLFAVNPLGRKVFSNGKEVLNFSLQPHTSVTFRYRVIIHSGSYLTTDQMNRFDREFEQRK